MTDFCCEKMRQWQKDSQDKTLKDHSIIYNKRQGSYCIYRNEETKKRIGEAVVEINYCPWCGVKLHGEL